MDVHDISRSARTFGIREYFIVTPIEEQHRVLGRILGHWQTAASKDWHPDRVEAVSLVRLVRTFEEVETAIRERHGEDPEVVLTDARPKMGATSYSDYRKLLEDPSRTRPLILVFGTGWGVADSFYPVVDRILAPVYGPEGDSTKGYNHLSVRAAVAIILDRLFGK